MFGPFSGNGVSRKNAFEIYWPLQSPKIWEWSIWVNLIISILTSYINLYYNQVPHNFLTADSCQYIIKLFKRLIWPVSEWSPTDHHKCLIMDEPQIWNFIRLWTVYYFVAFCSFFSGSHYVFHRDRQLKSGGT